MIDFKMDPVSRDMVFAPGASLILIDGAERVRQAVTIRLRTWLGEWFLDQTHGVPYVDGVLGKSRREIVEAILRAQILSVAGVRGIESFRLVIDPRARRAVVDFVVRTADGLVRSAASNLRPGNGSGGEAAGSVLLWDDGSPVLWDDGSPVEFT